MCVLEPVVVFCSSVLVMVAEVRCRVCAHMTCVITGVHVDHLLHCRGRMRMFGRSDP